MGSEMCIRDRERAALFSVAGVAKLVDAVSLEQAFGAGAVRVVAILAGHFSFGYRHVGLLAKLRALLLVAGLAGLCDAGFLHQTVGRKACHRVVAVGAG